jgi:hypothetical protein
MAVWFILSAPGCAADFLLPSAIGWGMNSNECESALIALGYKKASVKAPNEQRGESAKRVFGLVNGLRSMSYEKDGSSMFQRVTVYIYKEALCRATITFEKFGGGFKERTIAEMSREMSSEPVALSGARSGLDHYIWERGDTTVSLTYKEFPKLINFAELDYRYKPMVDRLKNLGLI